MCVCVEVVGGVWDGFCVHLVDLGGPLWGQWDGVCVGLWCSWGFVFVVGLFVYCFVIILLVVWLCAMVREWDVLGLLFNLGRCWLWCVVLYVHSVLYCWVRRLGQNFGMPLSECWFVRFAWDLRLLVEFWEAGPDDRVTLWIYWGCFVGWGGILGCGVVWV